jgi:hypothetical protein
MKNLQTFEEFVNEERVYGMFNDNQGKPSKLSKEILDICIKGLPKNIIDEIESIEAAGYFKTEMVSPSSVSNKGQSRGVIDYIAIGLIFNGPIGRNKITHMTVGLRKRTSGPGTGYLAIEIRSSGHEIPNGEHAIEWMDRPEQALEKLYNEKIKPLMQ